MWFKQVSVFRLPEKTEAAVLEQALATMAFVPPAGLDWYGIGFAPAAPFGQQLVFDTVNSLRVALKREERVLPAAVIRDALDKKIAAIEAAEARTVGRKEKQELKEQITDDLLPRAFTRPSRIEALITDGLLLVNTAGSNTAERLLSKLREALDSLEAQLPHTKESPSSLMTEWLLKGYADGLFDLDDAVLLKGEGDVAPVVRVSRHDLTADEVVHHVRSGKKVAELGLIWNERISLVLTQDMTFKNIRYLDVLTQEAENDSDSAQDLFAAGQTIMAHDLAAMVQELAWLLQGWQE